MLVQKIKPHLWFDTQAVEAARFYTSTFPNSKVTDVTTIHDTPSGDTDVVSFELFGEGFQAISAGPLFTFTPSISFLVLCESEEEVDTYWRALSEGGTALMPLDSYPHSKRYGWTQDRYGLSWQLMLADGHVGQRVVPSLMYVGDVAGKAEEAINFYTSLFDDSSVGDVLRYGKGEEPDREGTLKYAGF
jgi:predicted 3-demethylubiquinone-9 3-methyltransferase (glyoxalase superfamily)